MCPWKNRVGDVTKVAVIDCGHVVSQGLGWRTPATTRLGSGPFQLGTSVITGLGFLDADNPLGQQMRTHRIIVNGEYKVNDPYQTMRLPVTEFSGEPKDASPQGASPPNGMVNPPPSTTSYLQNGNADRSRVEPTVFSAVRRYRGMVIAVAVLAMLAAVGYSLLQPKVYSAQALITMPLPATQQGQQVDSGQYLDSQVILLQSQNVALLATTIANAHLPSHSLTVDDFFGSGSSLKISPPLAADVPGAYGATVVGLSFSAPTAQAAQVGVNAVIQAYDQTRSAAIQSQAKAAITGIDNAIDSINRQLGQQSGGGSGAAAQQQLLATRANLVNQRVQAIANEQIDLAQQLAQQPTVAVERAAVSNGKWALDGGIGLIIGVLIGGALAFVLDTRRRRSVAHSEDPSVKHGFQPLPMSAPPQPPPGG